MSYSTPAQFRAFVDRSTAAGARSTQQWGRSGTDQDANIQLALNAAANRINAAARKGGYTTPVTQVGLGIGDAEWAEALAWLQVCEMAMATGSNLFPIDDTERYKAARAQCEQDLKMLTEGCALPTSAAGSGGGFEYIATTSVPTIDHETFSSPLRVPNP